MATRARSRRGAHWCLPSTRHLPFVSPYERRIDHQPLIVPGAIPMEDTGTCDQQEAMIGGGTVEKGERQVRPGVGRLPTDAKCQRFSGFVPHLDQVSTPHGAEMIEDRGAAGGIEVPKQLGSPPITGAVSARVPRHVIHTPWRAAIGQLRHRHRFNFCDHRQARHTDHLRPTGRGMKPAARGGGSAGAAEEGCKCGDQNEASRTNRWIDAHESECRSDAFGGSISPAVAVSGVVYDRR